MAHKALIGGTEYAIKGGRTLVNGTGYSVKVGTALVSGTGYKIKFAPIASVVITGVGATGQHSVKIGNTTYISAADGIEVEAGSIITFTVTSKSQPMVGGYSTAKVTVNGSTVFSVTDGKTGSFQWTVPDVSSIAIALPANMLGSGITVTTS